MLTSDLHLHFGHFAESSRQTLHIIAPYVRTDALKALIKNVTRSNIIVVTTWTTEDVLKGASDPEVFPYLESIGGYLYLRPGLHAKVLVSDLQAAIVSSANITSPALGISNPPNAECATHVNSMSASDLFWVLKLVGESLLVREDYYTSFLRHLEAQQATWAAVRPAEFDATPFLGRQHFLLSSLPMCDAPGELLDRAEQIGRGETDSMDRCELNSALHDIALYSLDVKLSRAANEDRLKAQFFDHPFIRAFVDQIRPRMYFGETKAWLQDHCTNVPIPRRRELTGHVRVLFDWLVELGGGEFVVDRPRHSECIRRNDTSF
ncbi:MAG TPA: hypothetical protein VGW12_11440 [Pyrinomonadaceae bacterium]|nr:hypothetical protein [Pyrinomonadaceae bacterium]